MQYELVINTDNAAHAARLYLHDQNGVQIASHAVDLTKHSPAMWEGLFDSRRYVDRHEGNLILNGNAEPASAEDIINQLGVFLGQELLGKEIIAKLNESSANRTLLIRLPSAEDDIMAAAFSRVPWEIARLSTNEKPLMEKNLVVRVITKDSDKQDAVIADAARKVSGAESLRVLFVFAEAPGSRPLAMRLERETLRKLFIKDIMPKQTVSIDFLCHGVTLDILKEQIKSRNGYYILHWSGHGHYNALELYGKDGKQELITGKKLAELFAEAGGFYPQIVFLSACHSGAFINVKDWEGINAVLTGKKPDTKDSDTQSLDSAIKKDSGYTGTALELLRSGIPQVVAMRYEVGDDYARELAHWFYKRLLADSGKPSTDSALSLARTDLLNDKEQAKQLGAINHATPILFGQPGRILEPIEKRSAQLKNINPKPSPLLLNNKELDPPENFVGRSAELTRLNAELFGDKACAALIQGLAGMGKTALAAEIIHLWHSRFDWVFAFQEKQTPLSPDDFLRRMDLNLSKCSSAYSETCESMPYAKIFLEPSPKITGNDRYDQMRTNLIAALQNEAILIILDNFETNLEDIPSTGGYKCKDPQWDKLLQTLSSELPKSKSRLLITTRRRPAALANSKSVLWIPLGPLPMLEAALYIKGNTALKKLFHSGNQGETLVFRLLSISRGHPLIMNRLAAIADNPETLSHAIDQIQQEGWRNLPDLFSENLTGDEKEKERKYLENVAIGAVDFLIQRISPDAQKLLWIITRANEPVAEGLIQGVWEGKTVEDEQLEQIRMMLKLVDMLPDEIKSKINEAMAKLTPEQRELLEKPATETTAPPLAPLLTELHKAGLLAKEKITTPEVEGVVYSFHELVRERISEWVKKDPPLGGRGVKAVWIAYGERYAEAFNTLLESGKPGAYETALELGRRALIYMVRAGAYDRLGNFASTLITSTNSPAFLHPIIAELKTIADQATPGIDRWRVRTSLADALRKSEQADKSLSFYEQAATEAEQAGNWSDVGWICGNHAAALYMLGRLDLARAMQLKSAEAEKKAGRPKVNVIGSELEALRIDVMQRRAAEVLPEINSRLDQIRIWQNLTLSGETVSEAPDPVDLGRALVSGIDIAEDANHQLEQWQTCLNLIAEIEQTKKHMGQSRHEQYRTRFNQYFPLIKLNRIDDAKQVVESCLSVFQEAGDDHGQSKALSALASIWYERGDIHHAISLERQALNVSNRLTDPKDRAISHNNLSII